MNVIGSVLGIFMVLFIVSLPFLFVLALVWLIVVLVRGGKKKANAQATLTKEEEEILNGLWKGLEKMETRIDNLETILDSRTGATAASPRP